MARENKGINTMKSMHLLLNEAERDWRDDVRRDFPLRSDTAVVRKSSQNGRDWLFSTDLKQIYADIWSKTSQKIESLEQRLFCSRLHIRHVQHGYCRGPRRFDSR